MKTLKVISILLMLLTLVALPMSTEAKTITEFEAEVKNYTQNLENVKNQIVTNEAEVAKIKANISSIEVQVKNAEKEIETLQEEIDKSNEEIKEKSEESKKIIEYYQISNGENIYLEYAFGATSITDMIYRMSIVEQLTEYNDKLMDELEALIAKNKKQQENLNAKKKQLEKSKENLINQKLKLDADSAALKAGVPGIEQQIKAAKSQLDFYKKLGCGPSEDIQACQRRIENQNNQSLPSVNGYFRPLEHGYVTQWYSGCGTWSSTKRVCSGHIGIDISSSNKSIDVYPIAAGVVFARYYDSAGALVVKVKHKLDNGTYIYSTYAHQRNFKVSLGQYVSVNTSLGQMGSTGNSTGPHVHLEITSCDWNPGGGCLWESYSRYSTYNPTDFVRFPSKWTNR